MSRSRRAYPARGITTAESEKDDKRQFNRRFRRSVKQALHSMPDADVLPHLYDYSDPWAMAKDGKRRFDPQQSPHVRRK